MSLRRFHIAAIAAAALAASSVAAAAGPWALAPGEYYTELRGSFFSTGTFYDDDGNRMPSGGLYEQRAVSSYTELGWKDHWSVQLSLPALSNTVRDGGSAATRSGFGDFGLGFRYSLVNGPSATALQFGWTAPAGYNTRLGPALGSGLQRLQASLELGRPLGTNGFVQVGGGYAYDFLTVGARSTDASDVASKRTWSDHALAHAAVGLWMGQLQVAGQYRGEIGTSSGLDLETTTHLAGPRLAYRMDERLDAIAGSWHSPGGKNVPHLNQFYAGVAWKMTKLNRLQGFLGGDKRP